MTDPWPWPGDTALDRARRIANSLLALLPDDERDVWAARAHAIGETWLGSEMVRWTNDDLLPPAEAARLVHAKPDLLRSWVRLGILRRVGTEYRVGDVLSAAAEVRRRRAKRKARGVAQA